MYCKPKHLGGLLFACTHAYVFNITSETAESKLYTIRARNSTQAHFSMNCPAIKFLEPSSDRAGMGPAKREDTELENP